MTGPKYSRDAQKGHGWFYEARTRIFWYLYFLPGFEDRWYKTRLSFSGCIEWRFCRSQRLRSEILHRSIKKIKTFYWKRKKLEQQVHLKIFGTKFFEKKQIEYFCFFIGNCMEMKKFEIEKNRNFSISFFLFSYNFQWKNRNFSISKFSKKCP